MTSLPEIHLVRFAPIYKEKVWGGRRLQHILERQLPQAAKIGESWEISALEPYQTRVSSGLLAGCTTEELVSLYGQKLLGDCHAGDDGFPLLFKFIDAHSMLSVQVHPDDAQSQAHGWGPRGKTECWYVVYAEPQAQVIAGFNRPVTTAEIEESIRRHSLPEILNYTTIAAGDLLLIPAGTVHANLAGALLYEVQQSCDTTLRLYDWERNDPQRPIHITESLSAIDTTFQPSYTIAPVSVVAGSRVEKKIRVVCRYFAIAEYRLAPGAQFELDSTGSFQVITVLAGSIVVRYHGAAELAKKGETILLPASPPGTIGVYAKYHAHMLLSWVPDLEKEIVRPLRSQGVPDAAIEALGGAHPHKNDLRELLLNSR